MKWRSIVAQFTADKTSSIATVHVSVCLFSWLMVKKKDKISFEVRNIIYIQKQNVSF